ncbi:MAG: type II secretion system F family protein [Candidatus Omnitrophica bacterium]|nr:type II secretion system F family protein [Candidatus Omnitrophota bacterium]
MAIYQYTALTTTGETTSGKIEASDRSSVLKLLKEQKLIPVQIEDASGEGSGASARAKKTARRGKVKIRDLVMFTHQMNSVLRANIPLTQALGIIGSQAESETLKEVLGEVREAIEGGASLADAMKEHPKVFPPLYTNTVRMGEMGGVLDQVMGQLAVFMESDYELNSEVKSAMYYPVAIIIMAVLSVTFILLAVMPKITPIFVSSGMELPAATKFLIGLGDFVGSKGYLILIAVAALIAGFRYMLSFEEGRYRWYRFLRATPGLGTFIVKVGVARIAQTLASLLQSGVPALDSLNLVADTVNDAVVKRGLKEACDKVRKGAGIAKPLAQSGVFPTLFIQMVRVGEESGELEAMFVQVANAYNLEVKYATKNFVSLMEPIIIGVMALVVMFIVLALAMPMMQISQMAGG